MQDIEISGKPDLGHKGIYLLPNLFTTAGLFAGFYSIVAAMKGLFDYAAVAILIAMVADSLDGRVARLSNTASAFGAQYDSIADMVGFGIAPALLAYNWALYGLGKLGWLAAFCYTAATGLRLARFNTQSKANKRYFYGLPCPPAAGFVAVVMWVQQLYSLQGGVVGIIDAIVVVCIAVLMVSNVQYRSFKDSDFKRNVSFFTILMLVVLFVAIAVDPPRVLLGIGCIYILSGPITALLRLRKGARHKGVE